MQSIQPDNFEIGKDSFGEIYHLALHGILLPWHLRRQFGIRFDVRHGEMMRCFFDDLRISYNDIRTPIDPMHRRGLSETATTILNRFHRIEISEKAKIIDDMAASNAWEVPFPNLRNPDSKVLIWQRSECYEPRRNSSPSLIRQLAELSLSHNTIPVIIGTPLGIRGACEIGDFFEDKFFSEGGHNICKQLWFQHAMFSHFGVKASIGMMSGVMDGAAMFFERKTLFFARSTDAQPRMAKVAMAVPGLHWLKTEYNDHLAKLDNRTLGDLQNIIWPSS